MNLPPTSNTLVTPRALPTALALVPVGTPRETTGANNIVPFARVPVRVLPNPPSTTPPGQPPGGQWFQVEGRTVYLPPTDRSFVSNDSDVGRAFFNALDRFYQEVFTRDRGAQVNGVTLWDFVTWRKLGSRADRGAELSTQEFMQFVDLQNRLVEGLAVSSSTSAGNEIRRVEPYGPPAPLGPPPPVTGTTGSATRETAARAAAVRHRIQAMLHGSEPVLEPREVRELLAKSGWNARQQQEVTLGLDYQRLSAEVQAGKHSGSRARLDQALGRIDQLRQRQATLGTQMITPAHLNHLGNAARLRYYEGYVSHFTQLIHRASQGETQALGTLQREGTQAAQTIASEIQAFDQGLRQVYGRSPWPAGHLKQLGESLKAWAATAPDLASGAGAQARAQAQAQSQARDQLSRMIQGEIPVPEAAAVQSLLAQSGWSGSDVSRAQLGLDYMRLMQGLQGGGYSSSRTGLNQALQQVEALQQRHASLGSLSPLHNDDFPQLQVMARSSYYRGFVQHWSTQWHLAVQGDDSARREVLQNGAEAARVIDSEILPFGRAYGLAGVLRLDSTLSTDQHQDLEVALRDFAEQLKEPIALSPQVPSSRSGTDLSGRDQDRSDRDWLPEPPPELQVDPPPGSDTTTAMTSSTGGHQEGTAASAGNTGHELSLADPGGSSEDQGERSVADGGTDDGDWGDASQPGNNRRDGLVIGTGAAMSNTAPVVNTELVTPEGRSLSEPQAGGIDLWTPGERDRRVTTIDEIRKRATLAKKFAQERGERPENVLLAFMNRQPGALPLQINDVHAHDGPHLLDVGDGPGWGTYDPKFIGNFPSHWTREQKMDETIRRLIQQSKEMGFGDTVIFAVGPRFAQRPSGSDGTLADGRNHPDYYLMQALTGEGPLPQTVLGKLEIDRAQGVVRSVKALENRYGEILEPFEMPIAEFEQTIIHEKLPQGVTVMRFVASPKGCQLHYGGSEIDEWVLDNFAALIAHERDKYGSNVVASRYVNGLMAGNPREADSYRHVLNSVRLVNQMEAKYDLPRGTIRVMWGETNLAKEIVHELGKQRPLVYNTREEKDNLHAWAQMMGVLGMPVVIHCDSGTPMQGRLNQTGNLIALRHPSNMANIKDLIAFAQRAHETDIIWAHAGLGFTVEMPSDYLDVLRTVLEKAPNVRIDVSWDAIHPYIEKDKAGWAQLMREFPTRFLFGSDSFAALLQFDGRRNTRMDVATSLQQTGLVEALDDINFELKDALFTTNYEDFVRPGLARVIEFRSHPANAQWLAGGMQGGQPPYIWERDEHSGEYRHDLTKNPRYVDMP